MRCNVYCVVSNQACHPHSSSRVSSIFSTFTLDETAAPNHKSTAQWNTSSNVLGPETIVICLLVKAISLRAMFKQSRFFGTKEGRGDTWLEKFSAKGEIETHWSAAVQQSNSSTRTNKCWTLDKFFASSVADQRLAVFRGPHRIASLL